MSGHCVGTHEAALRLALGAPRLPDPRTEPVPDGALADKRILDLGAGPNPWPWVAGGPTYLHRRAVKVTFDLPDAERPAEHEALWSDHHIAGDIDAFDWPDFLSRSCDALGVEDCADVAFDVIVAVELIEHVEAPGGLLRIISQLLEPRGGCAIVTTPNIGHPAARRFFADNGVPLWFTAGDLKSTGHLYPILPHTLEELARRAGLRVAAHAYNEPPPHWCEAATDAEREDVHENVHVWRLEKR